MYTFRSVIGTFQTIIREYPSIGIRMRSEYNIWLWIFLFSSSWISCLCLYICIYVKYYQQFCFYFYVLETWNAGGRILSMHWLNDNCLHKFWLKNACIHLKCQLVFACQTKEVFIFIFCSELSIPFRPPDASVFRLFRLIGNDKPC